MKFCHQDCDRSTHLGGFKNLPPQHLLFLADIPLNPHLSLPQKSTVAAVLAKAIRK